MDSVTHANTGKKFLVKLKWMPERDVGPVQFMSVFVCFVRVCLVLILNPFRITILQEPERYWERWTPKSGFIRPLNETLSLESKQIIAFSSIKISISKIQNRYAV